MKITCTLRRKEEGKPFGVPVESAEVGFIAEPENFELKDGEEIVYFIECERSEEKGLRASLPRGYKVSNTSAGLRLYHSVNFANNLGSARISAIHGK